MRQSVLGVTLLMVGASVSAQVPERPVPATSPEGIATAADKAAPPPTATLRYGKRPLNTGQLRVPNGKGPFPVAIVIHGGCWRAEMGGVAMEGFSEMLRRRGIATWDIDYARVGNPGGGWPGTFEDIRDGIDYLPKLAGKHRLDLSRTTVVGHSAGALFALWAAARPKLAAPWQPKSKAMKIRSVAAIDGPGALAPMIGVDQMVCGQPVVVPLMGGTPADRPEVYHVATPADHLPLGVRQLLVLGELGQFMQPYAQAVKALGDEVLTLAPKGANHFDIVTPGLPNGEAVADWIAFNAFGTTTAPPVQ